MKALRPLLAHLGVMLLAVAIFFLQGPSFVRHLADREADPGDCLLNSWILAWNAHALTTPGVDVWDAPLEYPVKNALTFSETMFGNLWLTAPVQWLTGNPVLAFNSLVLGSFVLSMYCTFLLVRGLTGSFGAGVVAGILFSFNPYRWSEIPHVQLLPFFWAPLALLLTHRFLETYRTRLLAGLLATLVAQYYTSIYLGTMLLITTAVFVAVYFLAERRGKDRFVFVTHRRLRRALLAGGLLAGLALAPLMVPYLRTARDWDFTRSQAENAGFSCEFLSFLVPNESFRSYTWLGERVEGRIRGYCGLGVLPWLLALGGVVSARRQPAPKVISRFAWTALAMAIFMLGPCLILFNRQRPVPLPYFLVYHLVPGCKAMRVPTRFIFPLLLCLAVLGGFAVAHALRILRGWRRPTRVAVGATFLGLLCLDYAVTENPGVLCEPRAAFPPVYDYLAASDNDRPLLELPARPGQQFRYLYYQTAHWRPMLGGESGGVTPAVVELAKRTGGMPTADTLRFLELTPALTLVIHLEAYPEAEREAWRRADLAPHGFRFAGLFGQALVWERQQALPPSASQLRVGHTELQFSRVLLGDRLDMTLILAAADRDKPWRCLERGLGDITVEVISRDGAVQLFAKSFTIPPYLLRGESACVTLDKVRGDFAGACRLRLRGPLLEGFETDVTPSFHKSSEDSLTSGPPVHKYCQRGPAPAVMGADSGFPGARLANGTPEAFLESFLKGLPP